MSGTPRDNGPSVKRFKKDDDNLWGDDLDENTLEECFFLASQVLSQREFPEQSTSKTEPRVSPGPSKSSSEVFKKPNPPSAFRPKQPSLIASSSSFTKKVFSSLPQSEKFTKKVPATSSQSETFPKQTNSIPTQLQVYPRKTSTANTSQSVSHIPKTMLPRSVQTPHPRSMESFASKHSPPASKPMRPSTSKQGPSSASRHMDISDQRTKDVSSRKGYSTDLGLEEIFSREMKAAKMPGTSRDTNVGDEFVFDLKSITKQEVVPKPTGAVLDTSIFTSHSTTSESHGKFEEIMRELEQMKFANKELQETLLTRDGEVAILRSQMESLKSNLTKKQMAKMKEVEEQEVQFREKVKKLEKELEKKGTLLEFKSLEVGNAEERCRLLESKKKLKFVEPQSPHIAGNFPSNAVPSTSTAKRPKEKKEQEKLTKETRNVLDREPDFYTTPLVGSHAYNLGLKISPYIFETTLKEADIPKIPYLFSQIHGDTLTPSGFSVQPLYVHLSKLLKMNNFNNWHGKITIEDIVWEAFMILNQQLEWLECHKKRFSKEEMLLLDYNVCQEASRVYKSEGHHLSAQSWYSREQSIELRRTLGLLSVLAGMNDHAAQYMADKISKKTYFPIEMYTKELAEEKLRKEQKKKKLLKISKKQQQIMDEEKWKEWKAKRNEEEKEEVKRIHEKAMDNELEALGLKREDWVDVNPDEEMKRCFTPISIIRNYVVRCRRMNKLSHFEPPLNLSRNQSEEKAEQHKQAPCGSSTVDEGQSSSVVFIRKEQRISEKIHLIHPMTWNLKTVEDRQRELGYKFVKQEIEWTPFKKTLDKWAKCLLPSPREKLQLQNADNEEMKKRKENAPQPLSTLYGNPIKLSEILKKIRKGELPPLIKDNNGLFYDSGEKYDFLEYLSKVLEIICIWRFTVPCNGVLYALVHLLRSIVSRVKLTEDRFPVLIKLIKDLILCRPSINVLIQLMHLLGSLSGIKPIQESLCNGTGPNPHLTNKEGLVTFSEGVPRYELQESKDVHWFNRSSCMITMLAWLMSVCRADVLNYSILGNATIDWLREVSELSLPYGLNWYELRKDKEFRDCQCRPRIIEALILLMWSCYKYLEETRFRSDHVFTEVNDFLGNSITFFQQMIQQESDMGIFMTNTEGEYQLVVHGLRLNMNKMNFNSNQKNSLEVLLDLEVQHSAMIPKVEVNETHKQMLQYALSCTDKNVYSDCFFDSDENSESEPDNDSEVCSESKPDNDSDVNSC